MFLAKTKAARAALKMPAFAYSVAIAVSTMCAVLVVVLPLIVKYGNTHKITAEFYTQLVPADAYLTPIVVAPAGLPGVASTETVTLPAVTLPAVTLPAVTLPAVTVANSSTTFVTTTTNTKLIGYAAYGANNNHTTTYTMGYEYTANMPSVTFFTDEHLTSYASVLFLPITPGMTFSHSPPLNTISITFTPLTNTSYATLVGGNLTTTVVVYPIKYSVRSLESVFGATTKTITIPNGTRVVDSNNMTYSKMFYPPNVPNSFSYYDLKKNFETSNASLYNDLYAETPFYVGTVNNEDHRFYKTTKTADVAKSVDNNNTLHVSSTAYEFVYAADDADLHTEVHLEPVTSAVPLASVVSDMFNKNYTMGFDAGKPNTVFTLVLANARIGLPTASFDAMFFNTRTSTWSTLAAGTVTHYTFTALPATQKDYASIDGLTKTFVYSTVYTYPPAAVPVDSLGYLGAPLSYYSVGNSANGTTSVTQDFGYTDGMLSLTYYTVNQTESAEIANVKFIINGDETKTYIYETTGSIITFIPTTISAITETKTGVNSTLTTFTTSYTFTLQDEV